MPGSLVVNQPTCGGHLRLPFESRNNDGVCEVATLSGGSRVRLARGWLAMATGAPVPTSVLAWVSVSRTTLEFDRDVPVVGDGEDLGRGREFQISVEHAAVRIRCARAAAGEALPALDPERVSVMAISSAAE
jgi:diacylglycerol kinase family enzyme